MKTVNPNNLKFKKIMYSLLLCFLTFMLSGCGDMTEFEDRDFIATLGIGLENNNLKVTYAKPDLKALTGQPAEKSDKLIVAFSGKNFGELEEKYSYTSEKKLDYNHLKAIIFESSVMKNVDFMRNILAYMEENYDISRNTKVFVTNDKVGDVVSLDENMDGSVGDYLENYYKNNRSKAVKEDCTIGDLINSMNNKNQITFIPVIKIRNKKPIIEGIGLYDGKACTEYLGEEDSKYVFIADRQVKSISLVLPSGYTTRISNIKTKYKYSLKDNLPYIFLEIDGDAKIIDYNVNLAEDKQSASTKKIKDEIELHVKNMIAYYFEDLVKNRKIDFLNLYRKSSIKSRKIWMLYENKHKEFLQDVAIGIIVDFKMKK